MKKTNKLIRLLACAFVLSGLAGYTMADDTVYERQRNRLVDTIQADVRSTSHFLGKDELDERVLQALRKVPRHEFVPEAQRPNAYLNRPLPIGYGQTISQPYIVAIMTDLLELDENSRVLEIGTGSAYQAAILAEVAGSVYTIEIIEALAERAARDLKRLGYEKVHSRAGDGYYGWEEGAPFDAIMVTAAASHIPPPLIKQLKPGGRMIIPVGGRFTVQHLVLVNKDQQNRITSRQLLPVRFVPLTGDR